MNDGTKQYWETHPTPDELRAILGPKWAVCRDTEKNRAEHGVCLSLPEYRAACAIALKRRRYGARSQ